ncbi:MAG: phosphoribosyltransferase family protein [Bryobacteraceae bacterium]
MHLLKYSQIRTLAAPLGAFLTAALPRQMGFDAVTAMPMHWMRKWQRGFNQAELLAKQVSRRTGIPYRTLVRRRKATPPQAGLSSVERRTNMSGAFDLPRRAAVKDLRILLVDDVLTTGATASACAAALKRGGAKYVAVLALARADRRAASHFSVDPGSVIDA